jgi:hypothetical protein
LASKLVIQTVLTSIISYFTVLKLRNKLNFTVLRNVFIKYSGSYICKEEPNVSPERKINSHISLIYTGHS